MTFNWGDVMIFLRNFTLLDELKEHDIVCYEEIRRIFNNYYPLHLFSTKSFKNIDFDKITIFYGGNGSGKTTLINNFRKIKCFKKGIN